MDGILFQIDAPHFCAGLIVEGNRVVQAAPIVSWAVGKPIGYLLFYCRRKGWRVDHVASAKAIR